MRLIRRTVATAVALSVLGGCGFSDSGLVPSLGGDDSQQSRTANGGDQARGGGSGTNQGSDSRTQIAQAPSSGVGPNAPSLGTTVFEPREIPAFQASNTFVGKKVVELREDLRRLQSNIAEHNQRLQQLRGNTISSARNYHSRVASINARLQVGTTPGNPELVQMWNDAQMDLARVDQVVDQMNQLANEAASTSALAAFLLDSVGASYSLSGAVEKDHEHLAILEDATNRTVVLVDRLLNELSEDISRQNSYLARERSNLSTLSLAVKNGEFYGASLANQAYGPAPAPTDTDARERVASQEPLVVIRFGRDNVQYEQPLYNAVSRALDQRPQAAFDVVAVAPQSGDQGQTSLDRSKARRFAERVLRSLNEMGLPPERVSLSATTNPDVNNNQVHIYVR